MGTSMLFGNHGYFLPIIMCVCDGTVQVACKETVGETLSAETVGFTGVSGV